MRACAQVHVEHREGFDLTTALRAAEAAVNERLGYTIALLEKPLYAPDGATVSDPNDDEEHTPTTTPQVSRYPLGGRDR